jgi:hypothetical protein
MHWFTCWFYLWAVEDKHADPDIVKTYVNTWLPINYRAAGGGPAMPLSEPTDSDYIGWFYDKNDRVTRYALVFNSVLNCMFGGGIGPVNIRQVTLLLLHQHLTLLPRYASKSS